MQINRKRTTAGLIGFVLMLIGVSVFGQTCTTTISTGTNLSTTLTNAAAGDTICLNSGAWGSVTLNNIQKSNYVTIRSTTGQGAVIGISVTGSTKFVRFKSLTMHGWSAEGTSNNLAVLDNLFDYNNGPNSGEGILDIESSGSTFLIDGNTFSGIDASPVWREGRLSVFGGASNVVISNNTFNGAGCSDGIQDGTGGLMIGPGNVFTGILQGSCTAHVDSIQGYGGSTITGNYFENNTVCLGYYDGGADMIFTNNVFNGGCVVDLGTLTNAIFNHNTLYNVSARVGSINQAGVGSGTYSENIMHASNFGPSAFYPGGGGHCTSPNCTYTHNMYSGTAEGTNNISGTPTYTGGSAPVSTWAGWRLTTGSTGHNAALDNGHDMGSNYFHLAPPTVH